MKLPWNLYNMGRISLTQPVCWGRSGNFRGSQYFGNLFIEAANGIIQVIGTVLMPPAGEDTTSGQPDGRGLLRRLRGAGRRHAQQNCRQILWHSPGLSGYCGGYQLIFENVSAVDRVAPGAFEISAGQAGCLACSDNVQCVVQPLDPPTMEADETSPLLPPETGQERSPATGLFYW